jgi:hypothetical protein
LADSPSRRGCPTFLSRFISAIPRCRASPTRGFENVVEGRTSTKANGEAHPLPWLARL